MTDPLDCLSASAEIKEPGGKAVLPTYANELQEIGQL
jgi:hypothetical protein